MQVAEVLLVDVIVAVKIAGNAGFGHEEDVGCRVRLWIRQRARPHAIEVLPIRHQLSQQHRVRQDGREVLKCAPIIGRGAVVDAMGDRGRGCRLAGLALVVVSLWTRPPGAEVLRKFFPES